GQQCLDESVLSTFLCAHSTQQPVASSNSVESSKSSSIGGSGACSELLPCGVANSTSTKTESCCPSRRCSPSIQYNNNSSAMVLSQHSPIAAKPTFYNASSTQKTFVTNYKNFQPVISKPPSSLRYHSSSVYNMMNYPNGQSCLDSNAPMKPMRNVYPVEAKSGMRGKKVPLLLMRCSAISKELETELRRVMKGRTEGRRKHAMLKSESDSADVPMWLKSLRLHKYTPMFQQMGYDEMMTLDERKLEALNVTKGARKKIMQSIQKLRERVSMLKQMEKSIENRGSDVGCVIVELRGTMNTPIRSFPPPCANPTTATKCHYTQALIDGIGFSADQLDDENLPGHITRILGKVHDAVMENNGDRIIPPLEDEYYVWLLQTYDRIINHEAFTTAQKHRVAGWKRAMRKVCSPPMGRRGARLPHASVLLASGNSSNSVANQQQLSPQVRIHISKLQQSFRMLNITNNSNTNNCNSNGNNNGNGGMNNNVNDEQNNNQKSSQSPPSSAPSNAASSQPQQAAQSQQPCLASNIFSQNSLQNIIATILNDACTSRLPFSAQTAAYYLGVASVTSLLSSPELMKQFQDWVCFSPSSLLFYLVMSGANTAPTVTAPFQQQQQQFHQQLLANVFVNNATQNHHPPTQQQVQSQSSTQLSPTSPSSQPSAAVINPNVTASNNSNNHTNNTANSSGTTSFLARQQQQQQQKSVELINSPVTTSSQVSSHVPAPPGVASIPSPLFNPASDQLSFQVMRPHAHTHSHHPRLPPQPQHSQQSQPQPQSVGHQKQSSSSSSSSIWSNFANSGGQSEQSPNQQQRSLVASCSAYSLSDMTSPAMVNGNLNVPLASPISDKPCFTTSSSNCVYPSTSLSSSAMNNPLNVSVNPTSSMNSAPVHRAHPSLYSTALDLSAANNHHGCCSSLISSSNHYGCASASCSTSAITTTTCSPLLDHFNDSLQHAFAPTISQTFTSPQQTAANHLMNANNSSAHTQAQAHVNSHNSTHRRSSSNTSPSLPSGLCSSSKWNDIEQTAQQCENANAAATSQSLFQSVSSLPLTHMSSMPTMHYPTVQQQRRLSNQESSSLFGGLMFLAARPACASSVSPSSRLGSTSSSSGYSSSASDRSSGAGSPPGLMVYNFASEHASGELDSMCRDVAALSFFADSQLLHINSTNSSCNVNKNNNSVQQHHQQQQQLSIGLSVLP
ncbi:unnamed protein product, partial [Anisakis simplex]|uniref:Protein Smaug (inferred by orthology to a D. melanogaster protein) n=1 Tax=Anisakis simplex TaxID=6269 RepID=A0A0M3JR49_ANISI